MKILVYEKSFLAVGGVLLVCCLIALGYASFAMGIHLPGEEGLIDPETAAETPPFDRLGVHRADDGSWQAVFMSSMWKFQPFEVNVPAGEEITFVTTSVDVIHGFHIAGTRLNMMVIPGQIARARYTFDEPGEYLLICHEYCGVNHHTMFGKVIVE